MSLSRKNNPQKFHGKNIESFFGKPDFTKENHKTSFHHLEIYYLNKDNFKSQFLLQYNASKNQSGFFEETIKNFFSQKVMIRGTHDRKDF